MSDTAFIVTSDPFDMEKLAAKFPGKLVFRGQPGELSGETEILGRVDQEELLVALKSCLLDKNRANAATPLPFVVTHNIEKTSSAGKMILYETIPVIVSLILVFLFHALGVL